VGYFLVIFGLFVGLSAAGAADRPNVVLIVADDLGFMDLGCNNPATFYETPQLDRLAASGIRFTQGYAACPVCSPTRASIMTGLYPPRTGVTDFILGTKTGKLLPPKAADHLDLSHATLAERLRDAGYRTFFAGKWHLGKGEFTPNAQGFGPGLLGDNQFYYPPDSPPTPADTDPKTTDRIADAAVRFIESAAEEPFFAYLPFLALHTPIKAPPSLVEKYERKKAQAPPDEWGQEGERKVRLVQNHAVYAAMLEQLDTAIGRVLSALDRRGLTDRTVVIFTSDNGGLSTSEGHPTSNVPLRAGKGWLYEGGIRTPWLIRAPGVASPGSTCNVPVITNDLYPTVLQLAGVPLPTDTSLDGQSLVPLLKGQPLPPRTLYWHYPHYGNQGGAPAGAIRMGEWKLIEWYEDGRHELFELALDPSEKRNLASEQRARAEAMAALLDAWRAEVGAKMPTRGEGE
jgi:arylsulfatase A-like enzyme